MLSGKIRTALYPPSLTDGVAVYPTNLHGAYTLAQFALIADNSEGQEHDSTQSRVLPGRSEDIG